MGAGPVKVSVIVFPGTNCDHDAVHLYRELLSAEVTEVWHRESELGAPDLVIVPGGFSYGDYLRTGALAKLSPIMREVKAFAERGGSVVGICNGFQILCECGLLPGALLMNIERKFLSRFIHLKVENNQTPVTTTMSKGEIITCPIAHFEGNYYADQDTIAELEGEGQVVFRYCACDGVVDAANRETNPNGSINAIAGICNRERNVVGFMPHPERAIESSVGYLGGASGLKLFEANPQTSL